RVEPCSHHAQWTDEIRKMRISDRPAQSAHHAPRSQKSAPWRKNGIHQREQAPSAFHLAGDLLETGTVVPMAPNGPDVRAHARSGDAVYLNAIFFEHLDDTDVSKPFCSAAREREPHATTSNFASEAVHMQIESAVWRTGCRARRIASHK